MVNGSLLLSLLERFGFQLVVHGHKHHPKLSYAAGGGASPAVLASGSLAAIATPILATNARNLFHLVAARFRCTAFLPWARRNSDMGVQRRPRLAPVDQSVSRISASQRIWLSVASA